MKNLHEIFEKYGIKIDKNQENQFDLYFHMLVEKNKVMNLTAITEEEDVLFKHFLDSVLPEKFIAKNAKIVDVGSGAGFPAIPLKIVRPDLDVCMVDSLNKRVDFLNEVVDKLQLKKTVAIHSRAEDFAKDNRESFDVAVARAVAPLNTLLEYLLPLVKVGGKAIVYKAAKFDEELAESEKAIKILGGKLEKIENFHVKEQNFDRKIVIFEKIAKTPAKYHRPQNKPKTNPIK